MSMRSALAFPAAFLIVGLLACDGEYRALGPDKDGGPSLLGGLTYSEAKALAAVALHADSYEVVVEEEDGLACAMTTFNGGENWAYINPEDEYRIPELGARFPEWLTLTEGPFANNPSPPTIALWLTDTYGEVFFDDPVTSVDFFYASSPDILVEGFDANGVSVASAEGGANSNGAYDVWTPLAVSADGNVISRLTFSSGALETGVDQFRVCRAEAAASTTLEVEVQVRPGSDQPIVNRRARGLVPVAIFSNAHFSAPDEIDPLTLSFGRNGEEPSLHLRADSEPNCRTQDANGNGLQDLVCHFRTEETGFGLGDTEGVLTGLTRAENRIEGRAPVRVIF